jgi:hypothetical protein
MVIGSDDHCQHHALTQKHTIDVSVGRQTCSIDNRRYAARRGPRLTLTLDLMGICSRMRNIEFDPRNSMPTPAFWMFKRVTCAGCRGCKGVTTKYLTRTPIARFPVLISRHMYIARSSCLSAPHIFHFSCQSPLTHSHNRNHRRRRSGYPHMSAAH